MSEIAERIKQLRAERGLSQRELAAAIGRSDGLVGQIESGKKPMSAEVAELMVKAFRLRGQKAAELRRLAARPSPTIEQRVERLEGVIDRLRDQQVGFIDVVTSAPLGEALRADPRLVEQLTHIRSMFDDDSVGRLKGNDADGGQAAQ